MTAQHIPLKTRNRIRLIEALLFSLILCISQLSFTHAREASKAAAMFPAGEDTYEFTNGEAEDAHDLHVKWNHAVTVKSSDPFKKSAGSGTSSTDFSGGTVKKGEKASIKVSWDGTDPEVKEWWWTKADGSRLGKVKKGNPPPSAEAVVKAVKAVMDWWRKIKFQTQYGDVIVNLPSDIRAGDTISGTVVAEAKGATEEERNKNQSVLNGYVIEVSRPNHSSETKVRAGKMFLPSNFRISVGDLPSSASTSERNIEIKLANNDGALVQSATVPIAPPIGFVITTASQFKLPTIGQTGRPVEITGPFDGSFENTTVTVGGQELTVLTESPRELGVRSPANVTGPTEIVVREGTKETKGEFRNVGVNLSAPKTSLLKGESTTLKIEVSGLQGITEPVPLHLTKGGVVNMQGGDMQTMSIKPAEVSNSGTFTTTRTITGVQAGGWNATATVVVFDICIQDDNDPTRVLLFMRHTGDYKFCPGHASDGGAPLNPLSSMDFTGGISVQAGDGLDVVTRNGAISFGDFLFTGGHVNLKVDDSTHSASATVQTTKPKQTFVIQDRDTRNNTCTCQ